MQTKGVYHAKLIKTFATIAIIVALIMLLALVLTSANIELSNSHMLQSALNIQITAIDSTLKYATETINRLTSDEDTINWIETEYGSPEYYFYALKLYKTLRSEISFQSYMNIDMAITSTDPRFFVVSAEGTMERKNYEYALSSSIEGPTAFPLIRNGRQYGITIIQPRTIKNQTMLFICSFSFSRDLLDSKYFDVAFYDKSRQELFGPDDDFNNAIKKYIATSPASFEAGRYKCFSKPYPENGFTLIYGYKGDSRVIPIMIIANIFLAFIFALSIAFSRITERLYKPVGEVVNEISLQDDDSKDEFAVIKDKCNKIEFLHSELKKALDEQYMLSEQQKYRSFIRGIPTEISDTDIPSAFTLALLSLDSDTEDRNIILTHLDSFSKGTPHLHFVRMDDPKEAVLIQKADTKEESHRMLIQTISRFIAEYENDEHIQFSLTESEIGYTCLPHLYSKAKDIIQYKYKERNKTILTENDISKDSPMMNFSFSDENKLIATLLAGKSDALDIFDRIVESNDLDSFLPQEQRRFSYLMVGIANRLFQELKEEPISLIGENINWSMLYNLPDTNEVLKEVRRILSATITAREKSETAENKKMITAMKDYINEHYMENIMLVDLSAEFNLTPKYCSSLFAQFSKDNFKTYLNTLRVQKACEMIEKEPDIKISYLSHKTGFSSANTFIRVFSKHIGVTPGQYAETILAQKRKNDE